MIITQPTGLGAIVKGDSISGAEFSEDHRYRYRLWRVFANAAQPVRFAGFVMLNPSTANESVLDPTLRRCEGFARAWGFDGFMVANVFAWRSTDPKQLTARLEDRIGIHNWDAIIRVATESELVVCGWGAFEVPESRAKSIALSLIRMHATSYHLGLTKAGHPKHPLYLRGDTKPTPWMDT